MVLGLVRVGWRALDRIPLGLKVGQSRLRGVKASGSVGQHLLLEGQSGQDVLPFRHLRQGDSLGSRGRLLLLPVVEDVVDRKRGRVFGGRPIDVGVPHVHEPLPQLQCHLLMWALTRRGLQGHFESSVKLGATIKIGQNYVTYEAVMLRMGEWKLTTW